MKSPIIIIGMHRSGTSLVAKVLEKAGIFMGVIKDHNYEAMHFLSLNQQTLWAASASWLEPKVPEKLFWKTIPAKALYNEHFKINGKLQQLSYALKSPAWGWKDPRNTFTLNMWLSLFPNAKVIHVTRDCEEVAKSLSKRNTVKGEVNDPRLNDMNFNRELWKKYIDQGRSYKKQLGNRYFEIDYHEISTLNKTAITQLEKFTGKQLSQLFIHYVKTS
ncbi:sulfotransferase [Owenweeksia hongkongensis]|uniref:sulfotransferase n=1 Tax=Owenweeksia hongkongensis TaxID=253245 RepID=UPI003A92DCBB